MLVSWLSSLKNNVPPMSSFIHLVQHEREYGEQELCSWLLDCDCYVSGQSQEWPRIPGLICLLSLLENPESFL